MFIDKNSIKVNNVSLGEYLVSVEYQYGKLWGDDTGRNLSGQFSGTLLRIAPKFVCNFRSLSTSELQLLAPILNSRYQSFEYNDPELGVKTLTTYTGDWSVAYNDIGVAQPIQISFIDTGTR